jgi:hypothetical protein
MRDELFDHLKHRLAETEVPDPGQGWQMMQPLLKATTPTRVYTLTRWWYAAAAACLILGGASWMIVHEARSGRQTTLAGVGTSPTQGKTPPALTAPALTTPAPAMTATGSSTTAMAPATMPGAKSFRPLSGLYAIPRISRTPVSGASAGSTASPEGPEVMLTLTHAIADIRVPAAISLRREQPLALSFHALASATTPVVGPLHPARHSRWGFEVGLGANLPGSMRTVTVNNRAKFEPGIYPVFNALYRLSSRLSLKTGLAAPSPVAYSKTLSQKSLNVNDSAYTYAGATVSTTQKIGRLLYLDVPLSIEWAVVPHLNLEAGLQFSHLLSRQEDTHTAVETSYNLVAYAPSVQLSENNPSQVRHTDIRCIVGAQYTWRRFSAGVRYQAGLQHAASQVDNQGNIIDNHTSVASMQIMYSLR